MKKSISVFLALLLLAFCAVPAFAAGEGVAALKINPYGGDEADIDTVKWFASSGKYFLFLPADTDLSAAKVYFTASDDVTLDGAPLVSGESAAAFTEGEHMLACGEAIYHLTVCLSASIPAVYMTTESGSLDYIHANKENKEPGTIRVYENGEKTLDKDLKQIKGRGNSTWTAYPKKPYNIKFDKKTSLLGMPKAKKWTLLANYFDYSLIHTANAFFFAENFGLPFTSEYRHADLYINGNYMGNYFICESVEIAENRIEINDLEKANETANPDVEIESLPRRGNGANGAVQSGSVKGSRKWTEIAQNPENISGGYLLEYEYAGRYNEEPCGFVTFNGQPVVIKSPEYASEAQVNYIADLVDAATEALYSESGYNAAGRHFSEYFDYDSLVNMYILQELAMNYDAALSSFYVFKAEDADQLVVSPVWDMDNAFGSRSGKYSTVLTDTSVWWANLMGYHNMQTMLTAAYHHASFRASVATRWAQLRQTDLFSRAEARMTALQDTLKKSATMNAIRWNHFSTTDVQIALQKWEENATVSIQFDILRGTALDRGFGANRAYLYYDKNGASSGDWGFVTKITEKGDTVTIKPITGSGTIKAPADRKFTSWNTKADGSGTTYLPGETLTLSEEYTILYAIWKTQAEIDAIEAAAQLAADKAAFEAAKADALAAADAKARTGDSAASQKLIADAKTAIAALTYDETHTLAQNKTEIQSILTDLDTALAAQREADAAAQNPAPSDNNNDSDGDYLQWLSHILQEIINFWRRVFRIK